MVGPLSGDKVHEAHGHSWIPVRRFGVWQSSGDVVKLRPIDNYAENRVNSAFSYLDKLDLRALDQVVWAAVAITRMAMKRIAEDINWTDMSVFDEFCKGVQNRR